MRRGFLGFSRNDGLALSGEGNGVSRGGDVLLADEDVEIRRIAEALGVSRTLAQSRAALLPDDVVRAQCDLIRHRFERGYVIRHCLGSDRELRGVLGLVRHWVQGESLRRIFVDPVDERIALVDPRWHVVHGARDVSRDEVRLVLAWPRRFQLTPM
jgi:hypothetical protein